MLDLFAIVKQGACHNSPTMRTCLLSTPEKAASLNSRSEPCITPGGCLADPLWGWSVVEVVLFALIPVGVLAIVAALAPLRSVAARTAMAWISRVAGWALVALAGVVVLVDLHNILYVEPNGPGTALDYVLIPPALVIGTVAVLVARYRRRRVTAA